MAEYTGKKTNTIDIRDAYESIEQLPLYNFDMYRKTGDANWFVAGFSGQQTKLPEHLLKPIETKLNEQYYKAVQDRSFELMIGRLAKIDTLVNKYKRCAILVERIAKGFGDSEAQQTARYLFITQLNAEGFKMPVMGSPTDDYYALEEVVARLEGIKTKIEILQDENKKLEGRVSMSLQKQMLIVSSGLQLGYRIDPKIVSVMEWIEMNRLLEEKSKMN